MSSSTTLVLPSIPVAPATDLSMLWANTNAALQQMNRQIQQLGGGLTVTKTGVTQNGTTGGTGVSIYPLAANSVDTIQLVDTSVINSKIAANAVATANILDTAITTLKIANSAVTSAQVAVNTITGGLTGNLASATITAYNIVAATITASQIAASTILGSNIAAATITGGNIAALTITASNIAANTITASQIAAGTITSNEIATGTIVANNIAAATITAAKLNIATLSAITANIGAITAGTIDVGTNDGRVKIQAGNAAVSPAILLGNQSFGVAGIYCDNSGQINIVAGGSSRLQVQPGGDCAFGANISAVNVNASTFVISNLSGLNTVVDNSLNFSGAKVTTTSDIVMQNQTKFYLNNGGAPGVYLRESWGANVVGDSTHPLRLDSCALALGTFNAGGTFTAGQIYFDTSAYLYISAGALHYHGSSGTDTLIAPA